MTPPVSEMLLDAAMDSVDDDVCPIDGKPLLYEETYDDCGYHACKYCETPHIWRMSHTYPYGPDPESVRECLEENDEPR